MKAITDKSKIIDTIDDLVGGYSRPTLFASSSSRRQHLPTPPRHKLRGSIGSSYFGCARNDLRSQRPSRGGQMQSSQYEPNGSTRVGQGSGRYVRGRVLSQSLLVARERRRRELGSNLVIDTISLNQLVRVMLHEFGDVTTRAEDFGRCTGIRCPSETTSWRYHFSRSNAPVLDCW